MAHNDHHTGTCFIFSIFVSMSWPSSIYVVSMWSIFIFSLIFITINHTISLKQTHFRSSHQRCSIKKGVLKNFSKFTGKHLCWRLFFNKVAGLQHRCFSVNFAKFLRTPFFTEHFRWLLVTLVFCTFLRVSHISFGW